MLIVPPVKKESIVCNVLKQVLLVDGDDVWVSLGSNHGFAKGDRVAVYKKLEKRNKAGLVVVTDFEPVCEIEVMKIQGDKSCGRKATKVSIDEGASVALAGLEISKLE